MKKISLAIMVILTMAVLIIPVVGCLDSLTVKTPNASYDRVGSDVAVGVEEGTLDKYKGLIVK